MSLKTTLDMLIDLQLRRGRRAYEGAALDSIEIKCLDFQIKQLKAQYQQQKAMGRIRRDGASGE